MTKENKINLNSILLVEDDEDHARLIKKALKMTFANLEKIFWVENGADAIEYLKKTGKFQTIETWMPSLILLDVKLPFKNGFEVLEVIKSDPVLRTIPVVMLTTTSTSEDIKKAMEIGANDYIIKPVKFEDFISKISNLGYYWNNISDATGILKN